MLRSNGALGLWAILGLSLGCSPSTGAGGPGGVGGLGGGSGLGGAGTSGTSGGGAAGDQGQAGSVSFGGDTFVIPDSGLTNHPLDAGCAGLTKQGEQLPLDIYIMFDQSASMSCAVGTGDRWSAVKSALSSFVQNQGASGIEVGLGYFGTAASPPGSSCKPEDYVPDVEISPLAVSAPAIVASLDAHNPLTDTPTLPAMESAITHAITWKAHYPSHTVVVVLVTDGEPNACGANTVAQVVGAADKGFAQGGIPTYVIGILSPGQTCALDPNQPNQADLDSVAKAGGTDAALIVDTTNATTDAGQQFLDTMNKIRQNAQIPCEYNIPPPPDGKTLAYDKTVNVGYRDPSNNPGKIYYVATKDQCDPNTGGGWYYDVDPSQGKPTKILLCPSTCTTVTSKFGYSVNIELNCPTEGPPR